MVQNKRERESKLQGRRGRKKPSKEAFVRQRNWRGKKEGYRRRQVEKEGRGKTKKHRKNAKRVQSAEKHFHYHHMTERKKKGVGTLCVLRRKRQNGENVKQQRRIAGKKKNLGTPNWETPLESSCH